MGFFSSVSSFVSSAASTISNGLSKAKEMAGKAIGWVAEKAEGFVDGVKKVWQTVKPFVAQIQTGIRLAADAVPWPWLKTALLALDKGITVLTAFENSPVARKIDEAIKWAIKLAKRWQAQKSQTSKEGLNTDDEMELSDDDLATAREHQATFRSVEREMGDTPERKQFELASAINDYEISKADLARTLAGEPANFEHYLRLRATQKLLKMAEDKFSRAETVSDLSLDDLFLVRIASNLIKENPELSSEAAIRLDRLLEQKYGKKLTPFVFEELIASWAMRAKDLGTQWQEANRKHAKDSMLLKRLLLAKDIQGELSIEETDELASLATEVPEEKENLDALSTKRRDIERYVGAIEGFLQLLEKTPEEIEAQDRSYLIDEGAEVGRILIHCAEHDLAFRDLTQEEQELITDYSNIFKKESEARMNNVLEITV
ncbi:hypothetical protein ABHF91_13700 [Pseudaeromonas sp. ZJS20]|uniref:hypothetical protein n=1 Tax=Pseudaeromonas aegiceratis TaxID=3153928 RepID=UPI00390CD5FF